LAINRSLSKPPLVELDAAVYRTPSCALALLAAAAFRIAWGKQFTTAVVCFDDDLDVCITPLKLPIAHRRVTRTSRVEG
jgi:transposase-like protein